MYSIAVRERGWREYEEMIMNINEDYRKRLEKKKGITQQQKGCTGSTYKKNCKTYTKLQNVLCEKNSGQTTTRVNRRPVWYIETDAGQAVGASSTTLI